MQKKTKTRSLSRTIQITSPTTVIAQARRQTSVESNSSSSHDPEDTQQHTRNYSQASQGSLPDFGG